MSSSAGRATRFDRRFAPATRVQGGERVARGARLGDRQSQRDPLEAGEGVGHPHRHRGARTGVGGQGGDDVRHLVPHDRDHRTVHLELVAQLPRRVQGVVLDDDRAQAQHGVESHDVLRAVRQHEGDPVARLHAEVTQARGRTLDLFAELGVGGAGSEELQRVMVAEPRDRGVEQVHERLGDGVDLGRHTLGVGGEPGPFGRCPGRVRCLHDLLLIRAPWVHPQPRQCGVTPPAYVYQRRGRRPLRG
jgi:hypothetical protein